MNDLKAIRFISGTKISHDYQGSNVNTFSYRELVERRVESIGIPARQNRLFIVDIDVPGQSHQHDGREWWRIFSEEYGIPETYTVQSPSGGFHYYFRIPESIDLDRFKPPGRPKDQDGNPILGVDFKYNGWVGAPPTPGYTIANGNIATIEELPASFLAYLSTITQNIGASKSISFDPANPVLDLHRPFTDDQLESLRDKISWVRVNGELTRDEWRDGIFSLRAGIPDDSVLEEFCEIWSRNKSYVEGDEQVAFEMALRADRFGPIGPGTIFSIIDTIMARFGARPIIDGGSKQSSPWTRDEIFNRAQIPIAFDKSGNIKIEPSETNAGTLIGTMYSTEELYWDIKKDLYMFKGEPYSDVELANKFVPVLQSSSKGLGLEKFRYSTVHRGLDILMATRQVDPHKRYLQQLIWDGVPRLDNFFMTYTGVENTEYHRIIGKNFWVAMAARGLNPGCKFDSMLILEGKEGTRKSTFVQAIGGERYTYTPLSNRAFEELDELRKMHQSVIVELPELIGLINRPDEMVKAFLSTSTDDIRDLYARKARPNKRSFVLVGTTNSDKYLGATMGFRRFWPVRIPDHVESIDTEGIARNRDQLFAEAVQYYRDGYKYWDVPRHLIEKANSSKIMEDPIEQCIKTLIHDDAPLQVYDIYQRLESIGYITKGLDIKMKRRIETALRSMNYGETDGVWYKTEGNGKAPSFIEQFADII